MPGDIEPDSDNSRIGSDPVGPKSVVGEPDLRTLILLRHGQSAWNRDLRFTGWFDADLTVEGANESVRAGALLAEHGAFPDVAHTSLLTRAIRSTEVVLHSLARSWIPVRRSWRLNERHYGALEGQGKKEAGSRYGAAQVRQWRRGYDVPPPPLEPDDPRHPRHDPRYSGVGRDALPGSESLRDVVARVRPYWQDSISSDLLAHQTVLVVAHGNSLRALVMHLLSMTPEEVADLDIATGQPWRFQLDSDLRVAGHGYLDPDAAAAAAVKVAHEAG